MPPSFGRIARETVRERNRYQVSLQEAGKKLLQWRRVLACAALGVLMAFMAVHVLFGQNGWVTYRHKQAEYRQLEQDIKQVDEENKKLDSEIKALKTDPKAIEKEAREDFRYAKPGEVIYLLPEQQGKPSPANQPPISARK